MRKIKTVQRIMLSMLLCFILISTISVQVFAGNGKDVKVGTFRFMSANSSMYMNVWTTGSGKQGDYIRLYPHTGDSTQYFTLQRDPSIGGFSLRLRDLPSLAVNKHSTSNNAILWPWSSGAIDSRLDVWNVGNVIGGLQGKMYSFELWHYADWSMARTTESSGSYCYFGRFAGPSEWKAL